MNCRLLKFVILLLLGIVPDSSARQRVPTVVKAPSAGYVSALAAANRFLNAWQSGDLETGMVLLSDNVRRSQSAESLESLFSRTSDRAFEINHGKCDRGSYRFPVVMVFGENRHVRRKFSEIVLVDSGNNDWVIDKLP